MSDPRSGRAIGQSGGSTLSARARLGLLSWLVLTGGCGLLDPPPIAITFRDSLVGAGKIIQVGNTSNEPLFDIEVVITAPDGDSRTFVQEQLGPYQTVEIGWKKLGGWEVPPGAEVEVEAKGHLLSVEARLPEGDLQ